MSVSLAIKPFVLNFKSLRLCEYYFQLQHLTDSHWYNKGCLYFCFPILITSERYSCLYDLKDEPD